MLLVSCLILGISVLGVNPVLIIGLQGGSVLNLGRCSGQINRISQHKLTVEQQTKPKDYVVLLPCSLIQISQMHLIKIRLLKFMVISPCAVLSFPTQEKHSTVTCVRCKLKHLTELQYFFFSNSLLPAHTWGRVISSLVNSNLIRYGCSWGLGIHVKLQLSV